LSENAKAIIRQAVAGDKDTSALISVLKPEWIENAHDQAIVRTIIDLSVSNKPISPGTISKRIAGVVGSDECRKLFRSQAAVKEYVEACENPDGSRIKAHADQIKLDYIKREIEAATKRVIDSLPTYQSAEDAASGAIEILASGVDATIGDRGAYSPEQAVEGFMQMREAERSGVYHTWEFPFPTWQRYARFKQSQIIVFAAPSETGKSWFGDHMLETACKAGDRVALFTGEMTPEEHVERLVKMGGISEAQLDTEAAARRLKEVMSWDFVIYDGTITIEKILAAVIRADAMGKPFHMVIVDHVHLMDFDGKDGYRLALNRAMSKFKGEIANRLRCGVVLLCQLRKPENSEPNRRPRKSDIRESAAIENIADWIFLMARTDEDNVQSTDAKIWNDKRRSGRRMPTIEVHISEKQNRLVEGVGSASAIF
jgi:replicative DNA helicase